jgi:hypothetical protein
MATNSMVSQVVLDALLDTGCCAFELEEKVFGSLPTRPGEASFTRVFYFPGAYTKSTLLM